MIHRDKPSEKAITWKGKRFIYKMRVRLSIRLKSRNPVWFNYNRETGKHENKMMRKLCSYGCYEMRDIGNELSMLRWVVGLIDEWTSLLMCLVCY